MEKWNDCINYLLTGAQHNVHSCMKKSLSPLAITPLQYSVLVCLLELEQHSPRDIANTLGVNNSTLTGIMDRMESRGLLRRMIDHSDRRFIYVEPTEKSRAVAADANRLVEEVNARVLRDYDEDNIILLKNMLQEISAAPLEAHQQNASTKVIYNRCLS